MSPSRGLQMVHNLSKVLGRQKGKIVTTVGSRYFPHTWNIVLKFDRNEYKIKLRGAQMPQLTCQSTLQTFACRIHENNWSTSTPSQTICWNKITLYSLWEPLKVKLNSPLVSITIIIPRASGDGTSNPIRFRAQSSRKSQSDQRGWGCNLRRQAKICAVQKIHLSTFVISSRIQVIFKNIFISSQP